MTGARSDWAISFSRALFDPRWRLVWSLTSVLLLVLFLIGDWLARSQGADSFLSPTAEALWIAVASGVVLGVLGALWERIQLRRRSSDELAFHSAPLGERLRWKYQRRNLLENGWFLMLMFALIGGCAYFGVFVLPPILAGNAVMFAANWRAASRFRTELDVKLGTEPKAAADGGRDSGSS